MAIQNHLEELYKAYEAAGGGRPELEAVLRNRQLSRAAKRRMETYRFFVGPAGDDPRPSYSLLQSSGRASTEEMRRFVNEILGVQFGRRGNATLWAPGSIQPLAPHTQPFFTRNGRGLGDVNPPIPDRELGFRPRAAVGSTGSDYIRSLSDMGWLNRSGLFTPPISSGRLREASDSALEDVLAQFSGHYRDDVSRMPSSVTSYVEEVADLVRERYSQRYSLLANRIVEVDTKIKRNQLALRQGNLGFMEREALVDEIRELRGDPFAPPKSRTLLSGRVIPQSQDDSLTSMILRKRALDNDIREIQQLIERVSPQLRDRIQADPVRAVQMGLGAHGRAVERIAEADSDLINNLTRVNKVEKEIRQSFRSERMRMTNLANIHDVRVADSGIFRGMPVKAEYVRREGYIYDDGRWRALTPDELESGFVADKRTQFRLRGIGESLQDLESKGRIRYGTAIKITPAAGADLTGATFTVGEATNVEQNVRRTDFLRRMDKTLNLPADTRTRSFKVEATDRVVAEVTGRLNAGFGVSDVWHAPMIFDNPAVEGKAQRLYRGVLGRDSMTPENLAKNLYLQMLYGSPKEKREAHVALKYISKRGDPVSKRAWAILQDQIPELKREVLPSMQRLTTPLAKTADELNIPRTAKIYESRIGEVSKDLLDLDRMRLRTEKVRDTMDLSRFTAQELDILSPQDVGPEWTVQRLREATSSEITDMFNEGDIARDALEKRRAADIAQGKRRKYVGHVGSGVSPERDATYERLFKRERLLNGFIQEDLEDLTGIMESSGTKEEFIQRSFAFSRDEGALSDLYDFFKREQKSLERSQRAFAAHKISGKSLVENIATAYTGDPTIGSYIAGTKYSPFEGTRDEVLARLYEMADQRRALSITAADGTTKDMTVHLLQQFDDDHIELTMLDELGVPQMYGLRWQQNVVNMDATDEIQGSIESAMRVQFGEQLSRMGLTGREYKDIMADKMAELRGALTRKARPGRPNAMERVASIVSERGSFAFDEVQQFMLQDADRYYARVGDVALEDVPRDLPVADALMRHMSLARGGFGVSTAIPQIANTSLFELDRNGLPRLNRAFAPLVSGEEGAIFRMDEVSPEARGALGEAVDTIAEHLRAQGIDLDEVVRVSDQIAAANITSESVTRRLGHEVGEFGFRQEGKAVAPILSAGQRLEMPLDFFRPGILNGLEPETVLNQVARNDLPTLGDAFAHALMYRTGSMDGMAQQPDIGTSDRLLKGISDAIAKQWGVLTSEDVLRESPEMQRIIRPVEPAQAMFNWMAGVRTPEPSFMPLEMAEELAPKVKRAGIREAMDFFGGTKTMRAAALGGAAFLAWGVVSSSKRNKDHSGEQIPHLPGGSPYETTNKPTAAPYIQSANMGAEQGGQLYYINARGSFDPTELQNQVQGITGGSMVTQVHSRPDTLRSDRPTIEQRLS